MTRKSKRELERDLEAIGPDEPDGFNSYQVGGDGDRATTRSGRYSWNRERGVYVNETTGVLCHPEHAPDPGSGFEYNVVYDGPHRVEQTVVDTEEPPADR